jgi:hypothetical protein
MSMLFTDIKLVGFFPISPLNWPLAKKSGASPRRLYHQVAIPVLAGLTAAHRHVMTQY